MTLKNKLIRYRLIDRHSRLACGTNEDMEVAHIILELLVTGKLALDLGDIAWRAECELSKAGVLICYSSRGMATAKLAK